MKKKFEFPKMEEILFEEEPIMDSVTGNNSIGFGSTAQQGSITGTFVGDDSEGQGGWF